jgi:tetratricopeptide (TPR) repeat protein
MGLGEFRKGVPEWYLFMGNVDEALREIELAVELDPVSQAIIRDQGMTLYYARQYDKAMEKGLIALDIDPDFIAVHRLLSLCYLAKGMFDAALIENKKWGALTMNDVKTKLALAHIYATAGKRKETEQLIDDINTHYLLGENDYRSMALIYAALGERDAAFYWLEESFERRESALCSLKLDPKLDSLRNDPRFEALVNKLGLVL